MIVFGITGPSGSGKSALTRVFADHGALVLDADAIYHRLLAESTELRAALTDAYSTDILTDGQIDRKKLGKIVFSSPALLQKLNGITHPFVIDEIKRLLAESTAHSAVIDAPLLFESGFDKKCDVIIAATAPEETLVERIVARDRIDVAAALRRLAVQLRRPLNGKGRILHQDQGRVFRQLCRQALHQGAGRPGGKDLGQVGVPVRLFALQGHKQVAFFHLAAVGGDAADEARRAVQRPAAEGGNFFNLQWDHAYFSIDRSMIFWHSSW